MFPLKHSEDRRYLVDRNGQPFPILGRSSWFVLSLNQDDRKLFLDHTVSRGFNSVEMHVLNHDARGNHPPFNGNHDQPFLKQLDGADWKGGLTYADPIKEAPDFTTPNEAYWRFADQFLSDCDSRGIAVFLFPVYVGWNGGEQGWMRELTANGPDKARAYGAWIAKRFRSRGNLVWMMGGDLGHFTPEQNTVESALLEGLKSVPDQKSTQFCAEWDSESIATDQPDFGSAMTLNGAYSFEGYVSRHSRRAYAHQPAMPSFLLEEPYDEEGPDGNSVNPHATQPVRRFQWAGWLGTIGGYIAGNGYIWPFRPTEWRSHLNSQGARDMAVLNRFVISIRWWELKPSGLDGMRDLVIEGGGKEEAPDYVSAAATSDGHLLVAYVPPAHSGPIVIDTTDMKGKCDGTWLNPFTGEKAATEMVPTHGRHAFDPPGDNGSGFSDWVLVLTAN